MTKDFGNSGASGDAAISHGIRLNEKGARTVSAGRPLLLVMG
ncbi:hypothetical protein [Paracoccus seriniphilus]